MIVPPDRAAAVYVGAFVDELVRGGLRHLCIAPGSRSAPLALTAARHAGMRTWMHLDERCAAYFALGMARALGEPVAVLCTSGTAAANFLPAVVEANAARVPLLVLTADRPPELRDVGAAQTIDQNRLYGAHAKWFVDVSLPETTVELLRYARTLAGRALARCRETPAGPVHLNFPFREPLVPVPGEPAADLTGADALVWHGRPAAAPWVRVAEARPRIEVQAGQQLAALLDAARRPLIVCGPQHDGALAAPLAALARVLGAPILADPLSQVRWGPHDRSAVIDRYDALLRDDATARSLVPDLVLRLGALPTSKTLLQFLQRDAETVHVVVDSAGWPDPPQLASVMVHAEPRAVCEVLRGAVTASVADAGWLAAWRRAGERAAGALAAYAEQLGEPFEGAILAEAAACVPSGGTLFVSSSMPVRDLDAFAAGDGRTLRVLANRGANGIDGVVSTALGVAAAAEGNGTPLLLVIGDIAFYHDMNGLLAARLHGLDATIVVINNDGGGIFSFLPQAGERDHFERLFGTPHGLSFEASAAMYGATYSRAAGIAALRTAVTAGLHGTGLHIVEVRTDRTRNVKLHHDAWAAVASALRDTHA